ncbi:acetyl-CoA C-acetyltransferase [Vagococcus intermedius]|uniref:acetyl-CoA C-acetyltransferase n=1 Tax=Vagococcus intermedius TaxID=2991418 RepID=A0AAF0I888_9ENTE|nr:acetyl-CoA C-acetyltransferase [Vagococcus intermedius]WEG73666.1 acetyl-CoA C-acetyltransferase [Vagococcus intermedius]WEG75750.1 acetyl-CoA C-acetyltransferase [Vagococcus intermedius]
MREVVIVGAARTPIGKFKGAFKDTSAVALGTIAVKEALQRADLSPTKVDQVILGNVLQAGNGQNPARQVAIHAGIPQTTPAMTINEVCGSGLKTVILGKQAIQLGISDTVVVGGIENMSQSPLLHHRMGKDQAFDENLLVDSMILDGLTDAFSHQHMGTTAEAVAEKYQISREDQDTYANKSQLKAYHAQQAGYFDEEIVAVTTPDGLVVTQDEGIRGSSTLEKLATLKTVFQKDGSVTAGNASTINDGASALVLMAKEVAEKRGIPYQAIVGEYTEIGNDPNYMGYAPYYAIKDLLAKMTLKTTDIDLFEINEAFASQSLAIVKDLDLPPERVNINGGAIALGHPLGASGARILTTLLYSLEREHKKQGIASLCVGGGIGLALAISRPE